MRHLACSCIDVASLRRGLRAAVPLLPTALGEISCAVTDFTLTHQGSTGLVKLAVSCFPCRCSPEELRQVGPFHGCRSYMGTGPSLG